MCALILSPRLREGDLEAWLAREREDLAWAASRRLETLEAQALAALRAFRAGGTFYAGVSWGKDSTVLAHLIARSGLDVPLAWVRVEPIASPECALVRDAFLSRFPSVRYVEVEVRCREDADGPHATGTLELGFAEVVERVGTRRYASGVRADESTARMLRVARLGLVGADTCAPLGRWTARDVFAHLASFDLPVHPAYAMTLGGRLERDEVRVASLGGQRGTGMGRAEWERVYYPGWR